MWKYMNSCTSSIKSTAESLQYTLVRCWKHRKCYISDEMKWNEPMKEKREKSNQKKRSWKKFPNWFLESHMQKWCSLQIVIFWISIEFAISNDNIVCSVLCVMVDNEKSFIVSYSIAQFTLLTGYKWDSLNICLSFHRPSGAVGPWNWNHTTFASLMPRSELESLLENFYMYKSCETNSPEDYHSWRMPFKF